jgi:hypothetical protein
MRLFGAPYQFTDDVDPRMSDISTSIGSNYMRNFLIEAPVCTIIPGEPKYLPNTSDDEDEKEAVTQALTTSILEGSSGFSSLADYITGTTNEDLRLYDFKRNYTDYMKYVNALCRAGAVMLNITDTLDGTALAQYDWRNYRPDGSTYSSVLTSIGNDGKTLVDSLKQGWETIKTNIQSGAFIISTSTGTTDEDAEEMENLLATSNYVQFYIDPDSGADETMSNTSGDSMIKSAFDSAQSMLKEIAFLANSGGLGDSADAIADFASGSADAINSFISSYASSDGIVGQTSTFMSRILNLSSSVIKGENMILPQIYQSSTYTKSYSVTVHLKTPYGNKLGYYMNIFVPMMHLLALALPRQGTANTYSSPFLIKAYVDGVFSCNMGLVESIQIQRVSDSWSAEGLPNEVDVTLSIADLYSALTMSSSSDPTLFVNNSSLIEYLATNCGLSILATSVKTKVNLIMSSYGNAFSDIDNNISSAVNEYMDSVITKFVTLMG